MPCILSICQSIPQTMRIINMNVIIEFLNRTNIFNHVYFYVFGYTLSKLTIPPVVIKNVLVLDSIRFGISHCPDPVPDPVIKKCIRLETLSHNAYHHASKAFHTSNKWQEKHIYPQTFTQTNQKPHIHK